MRNLIYNLSIIILTTFIQSVNAQVDSFRIVTKFNHKIENGQISQKKYATNQKTYNRQNILVRETNYSDETFQPAEIIYYHYDNNNLVFAENISIENNPIEYIVYKYSKGNLSQKLTYKYVNNKPQFSGKVKYKYKKGNTYETHYNSRKKKSYKVVRTFSDSRPHTVIKEYLKNDSLASKKIVYEYKDSVLMSKYKILHYKTGETDSTSIVFKYLNGRLSSIDKKNSDGLISRESYMYFADGRISSINTVNSKFKVVSNYSFFIPGIRFSFSSKSNSRDQIKIN